MNRKVKREPEMCDDCGEMVGYYDPSGPPGDKIVLTRKCACVREHEKRRGRAVPGLRGDR